MALFDLAGIVATGRSIAAQAREGADTYAIKRTTSTSGGEGGSNQSEATVESGQCILTAGATRPEERAIADRAGSETPYVLRNLPYNTILTANDTVTINGREFQILGVLRNEAVNVAVTAVAKEST